MELKPCPFCGSSRAYSRPDGERRAGKPWPVYYVHCGNCGCDGPLIQIHNLDVPSEAARNASIDLWNWRANE